MKQAQLNRVPGDAQAVGLRNHTLGSTAPEQWLSKGSFAHRGHGVSEGIFDRHDLEDATGILCCQTVYYVQDNPPHQLPH